MTTNGFLEEGWIGIVAGIPSKDRCSPPLKLNMGEGWMVWTNCGIIPGFQELWLKCPTPICTIKEQQGDGKPRQEETTQLTGLSFICTGKLKIGRSKWSHLGGNDPALSKPAPLILALKHQSVLKSWDTSDLQQDLSIGGGGWFLEKALLPPTCDSSVTSDEG